MLTIGIVGCGAIGRAIVAAVDSGRLDVRLAGVTSRAEAPARAFLTTLQHPPPYVSRSELIERADLVLEAAGGSVVADLAVECFTTGTDLLLVSVGALLDHAEIITMAREHGRQLLIPSGAIAGLDGVKAACEGEVHLVRMTTRKPPRALAGAPYLVEHGISLLGLSEETELFSGTAREACRGFPENLNIAAALSLAGLGPDQTWVRILAVPGLARNCHEVEVEGEFGRLVVRVENEPSENPRTGRLTALSVIRAIRDAAGRVHIGT